MWQTKDSALIQRVLSTNLPLKIKKHNTMVLVDTGRKKTCLSVLEHLSAFEAETFKLIILTHTHHDHIENLSEILACFDVDVLVHISEADNVREFVNPEKLIVFTERFDLTSYGLNGYVVHTPGHSEGSSTIVLNNEYALIGDIVGDIYTKKWAKNNKVLSLESLDSFHKILGLKCRLYFPAHKKYIYSFEELNNLVNRYMTGDRIIE
ncbi:MAG: MBL fold metallo-hydrolase [Clostridiales bacterium]|nr:MBL fold metallo-hydrolase [Clostridiales bacterium]